MSAMSEPSHSASKKYEGQRPGLNVRCTHVAQTWNKLSEFGGLKGIGINLSEKGLVTEELLTSSSTKPNSAC